MHNWTVSQGAACSRCHCIRGRELRYPHGNSRVCSVCKSIKTPSFTECPAAAQAAKEQAHCLLALLTATHSCCRASSQREIVRHASSFVRILGYQHCTAWGAVQQSRDVLFAAEFLKIQHTAIESTLINDSNYFGSIWEWKALFFFSRSFSISYTKAEFNINSCLGWT